MACRSFMHTSNPSHEYTFTWTIENYHHSNLLVRGPTFSPITGCSDIFCFEVSFETEGVFKQPQMKPRVFASYFNLKLVDLSSSEVDFRTLHGKVVLRNKEKLLCENNCDSFEQEKCITLMTYKHNHVSSCLSMTDEELLAFSGLADGELTLSGSLIFAGYLKSQIFSLPVPKSPENCDDLAKDFKSLYENGTLSDVTLTVGDQSYPAHKVVLAARSEVFAKMFQLPMSESNTNNVKIEDVDAPTFKEFMLFLYTGCLKRDMPAESAVLLYSLARLYQVKSLYKACVSVLGNSLSIDYVCDALVVADLHDDDEFKGVVKAIIREKFFEVAVSASWAEIVTSKPELAREVYNFVKPVSL